MKKILIIEDEKNLLRFLELELRHEGYETFSQEDGRKGLKLALECDWDVILLDLMLPSMNGIEVCRRIRQEKNTPIIMMTARDSVMDRVIGLDQGADDYIAKPFAIEELLARLRSVLRRVDYDNKDNVRHSKDVKVLVNGDLTMDLTSREVRRQGVLIELTTREFEILEYFLRHKGEVLTRPAIVKQLWEDIDNPHNTNIVDVYVRYLRNKIDHSKEKSMIETVRGVGYVMEDRGRE